MLLFFDNGFAGLNVETVDERSLHYYKTYECRSRSTFALLETGDGQCGAWYLFFMDVIKGQGIIRADTRVELISQERKNGEQQAGFAVAGWNFPTHAGKAHDAIVREPGDKTDGLIGRFPYVNVVANDLWMDGILNSEKNGYEWAYADVEDQNGTAGQTNENPHSIFTSHIFAQFDVGNGMEWFDPSYGVRYPGATANERELYFDDHHVAAYVRMINNAEVSESGIGVDLNGDGDMNDIVTRRVFLFRKNIIDTKEMVRK